MRVLMINHFPLEGSGSGVYTTNIAKSLSKKGHEVCIIMPENTMNYKLYEKIKLHPVYFHNKEKIEGELSFNFPCFTTHPKSVNNFFNMTGNQIEVYKDAFEKAIKEEINTFKPDIIHVQHIWILASVANKFNIPVIITTHGTGLIGHEKDDRYHKYTYDATRKCKQIISISKDNKASVINKFPYTKNKITLIKNGYDDNIFYKENLDKEKVLKDLGINKNYKKVVCFAGKMTQIKGIDLLLKAAKNYEDSDTLTLIAGNGELFDDLNNLSKYLGLKNIVFLGNKDQETLRKIYNISDVSVVPSRFEAFGLVAIEALACGTPVIASKVGGLPGIINNDIGRLIEVDDYIMLSYYIKDILDGKLKFDSNYIRRYIKENYSQEYLIDDLIKIYEKYI